MNARNSIPSLRCVAIAAALAVGLSVGTKTVTAQDALGAGDALDANLSIDGTSNIPSVDTTQAYRVRNLLVTGNVAGGREFRESVGYTAAEDFRGSLGSDDLFRFRADSAYSAPNYVLYKDQLTDIRIGQDLSLMEYRRDFTSGGSTATATPFDARSASQLNMTQLRLDRLVSDVSLSQEIERATESRPFAVGTDADGNQIVPMTTSILGIQNMPLEYVRYTAGMSVLDRAELLQELQQQTPGTQPAVEPYRKTFADLLNVDGRVQTQAAENRVDSKNESYEEMMREVAQRYSGVEPLDTVKVAELDEKFNELKRYLSGDLSVAATDEPTLEDEGTGVEPSDPALPSLPEIDQPASTSPVPGDIDPTRDVIPTLESFGIALRHGQVIDTYATGEDSRFTELVKQAEQSLASGEYFWAERRFQRALRFEQNHPLASAGRGHAQLGAGLYLPAALTLKFVLTRYPELIDVRYNENLLPPNVRLSQNIDVVRERIQQETDSADMGFLLAYIGHQLSDRAMVDEGLSVLEDHAPSDRLLPLLKSVWLGKDATPPPNPPAEK